MGGSFVGGSSTALCETPHSLEDTLHSQAEGLATASPDENEVDPLAMLAGMAVGCETFAGTAADDLASSGNEEEALAFPALLPSEALASTVQQSGPVDAASVEQWYASLLVSFNHWEQACGGA